MSTNRGGIVKTSREEKRQHAIESVERHREVLERNIGTITEQDWRDALQRAEKRLEELS